MADLRTCRNFLSSNKDKLAEDILKAPIKDNITLTPFPFVF